MQFVAGAQIREGMCVAEDICDHQGRVLIARGQRIGGAHVARLRKFGIHSIFIDPNNGEKPAPPVKSDMRRQCEALLSETCKQVACRQPGQPPELHALAVRSAADSLIQSLIKSRKTVLNMNNGPAETDRTMAHSVNAAALAVALGIDFRLPETALQDLGGAMLLHDVGFLMLPDALTAKTEPLTTNDVKILKQHPVLGYDHLMRSGALNPAASMIVLNHHERLDGSGYPQGLPAARLTLPMKIAAVAEAFDSLTNDRFGIPGVLPDTAMAWLANNAGKLFDRDVVDALNYRIPLYPNGTAVRLTTGECGIVAGTLPRFPRRPVVLVHIDARGRKLTNPMIVDLTNEAGRGIAKTAATLEMLQPAHASPVPPASIDPVLAAIG